VARPEKPAINTGIEADSKPRVSKNPMKTAAGGNMLALEPRILLDAALADTAAKIADAVSHDGNAPHIEAKQVDKDIFKALAPMGRDQIRREIIFVDSRTENLKELLGKATPSRQVVVLSPNRDGVVQITRVLSRMQNVDAVHIFSHGDSGRIQLGKGELSIDNIQKYQKYLKAWASHMTNAADIMIYGCDVAEGQKGADFVRMLSELTRADVAASTDLTGAADKGGDWVLEKVVGRIETDVALSVHGREEFHDTLVYDPAAFGNNRLVFNNAQARVAIDNTGNSLPVILTAGSSMTLEAWVKPDANVGTSNAGNIMGVVSGLGINNASTRANPGEIGLIGSGTGNLIFYFRTQTANGVTGSGPSQVATSAIITHDGNTWTHLAAVKDGTTGAVTLYVNGVSQATGPVTAGAASNTILIGARDSLTSQSFHGQIDEVRIWNTQRTGADISTAMDTQLTGTTNTGLMAYYQLNDGTVSTTATDLAATANAAGVANAHNGTLTDSTLGAVAYGATTPSWVNPPALSTNTGLTVLEDATATVIANTALQTTDVDNSPATLTYTINTSTLKGTLTNNNVTMGASSTFTQADIDAGLIKYTPTANANGADSFTFNVSDGTTSLAGTFNLTVSAVNDAPTMTLAATSLNTFVEGSTAIVIDGSAVISDVDLNATNYNGATLTVARNTTPNSSDVFGGSGSGGTALAFTGSGSGNVLIGSTVIGTYVQASGTLTITFGSLATQAMVNNVVTQLTYSNSSQTPPASVNLDFTFNDKNTGAQGATGGNNLTVTKTVAVNITAVNNAPTLTGLDTTSANTFNEGGGAVVIDANAVIADPELSATNYSGSTLTIARTTTPSTDDVFGVIGTLTFSGSNVQISGVTVGTFTQSAGTLTITFNASATATLVNNVLNQLTYSNSSQAPASSVSLDVKFNDQNIAPAQGTGAAASVTQQISMTIAAVNNTPTLTGLDATSANTFAEGSTAVVIDSNAVIADAELSAASNYSGSTLTIARTTTPSTDDVFGVIGTLTFSGSNVQISGVTVGTFTQSAGTLTITFNASATATLVNNVLNQLTYSNSSQVPPTSVSLDVIFNDQNIAPAQGSGAAASVTQTIAMQVAPANDAPTMSFATGTTYSVGTPVVLDASAVISDLELNATNYSGSTLTIVRNGAPGAADTFSAKTAGTLGSITAASGNVVIGATTIGTFTNAGGTLVFTFNGNATQTLVNEALTQIAYANDTDTGPVLLDVTFNDQNGTAQGSGGALFITKQISVTITTGSTASITGITPDTGSSSSDYYTNTGSVTLNGGLTSLLGAGQKVQYRFDAGTWTDLTTQPTGTSWAQNITLPGNATTLVSTRVVDAGNVLVNTGGTQNITVDSLVPSTVPTVTAQTYNTATPTIGGSATLAAGETMQVVVGGATYDVTPSGGTWTLNLGTTTPASGSLSLSQGANDVAITVTDQAGNTTLDTTTGEVTIDTVAPTAPTVNAVTGNATPTITGTATLLAGETLSVTVGGATYANVPVSAGAWSLDTTTTHTGTLTLTPDGVYQVVATVTDAAGNATSDSSTNELTVDTTAPNPPPNAPVITGFTSPLNLAGAATGAPITVALPATVGPAVDPVAGDTVNINWGGQVFSRVITGGEITAGTLIVTVPEATILAQGTGSPVTVTSSLTDQAGNTSTLSPLVSVNTDLIAPTTPTVNTLFTSSLTPVITGTYPSGDAGGGLTVTVAGQTYTLGGGNPQDAALTNPAGTTWSLDLSNVNATALPTANQPYEVVVTVTDTAGNPTVDTTSGEITHDNIAPAAATGVPLVTNNTQPVLTGTFDAASIANGGRFTLDDGNPGGLYTVGVTNGFTANGNTWTLDYAVEGTAYAAGLYDYTAKTTDAAGNVSSVLLAGLMTIDTGTPAAPTVTALTSSSTTPVLSGTASLSTTNVLTGITAESLTVTVGGATYNVTPSGGTWSLDLATATPASGVLSLALGNSYAVTATLTDAAGNAASDSTTNELSIIDSTPPLAPVISGPVDGANISGSSTNLSGTGEAGATMRVYDTDNVTLLGTTTVAANGTWSLANVRIGSGDHTIHARQTDAAGNVSPDKVISFSVSAVDPSTLITSSAITAGASFSSIAGSTSGSISLVDAGSPVMDTVQESLQQEATLQTDLSTTGDTTTQGSTSVDATGAVAGGDQGTAEGTLNNALNTPSGAGPARPGADAGRNAIRLPVGDRNSLNVSDALRGQVVQLSANSFEILLPASAINVGDIIFMATRGDGTPLPDYIEIDPVTGKVTINRDKAPLGINKVDIKLTRIVQIGEQKDVKSASVAITVNKEAKVNLGENRQAPAPKAPGA